jgi:hypothetical protein
MKEKEITGPEVAEWFKKYQSLSEEQKVIVPEPLE